MKDNKINAMIGYYGYLLIHEEQSFTDKELEICILNGIQVIDTRSLDARVFDESIISIPRASTRYDSPPYDAFSKAPIEIVADLWRQVGATTYNINYLDATSEFTCDHLNIDRLFKNSKVLAKIRDVILDAKEDAERAIIDHTITRDISVRVAPYKVIEFLEEFESVLTYKALLLKTSQTNEIDAVSDFMKEAEERHDEIQKSFRREHYERDDIITALKKERKVFEGIRRAIL